MKKIINRLICLFKGHKWEKQYKEYYKSYVIWTECKKCGKVKKE